ncbi:MAG: DUF362 domain-containing protein [Desulfuromonadales bacterium]|nr:DUF362 domain-containing protein [Desulfuromonadales bacterium]
MKKCKVTRREFLQVGAGAAAGLMTTSIIGCSSGGGINFVSQSSGKSSTEWYQGQQSVTAVYQPINSALYRQLLPATFDMPDSLQVIVAIAYYSTVSFPLTPYHEAYVLLACSHQGKSGLYTLTMPVDNKRANDIGRSIGYPKYIADGIELTESSGTWSGQVNHQGRTVMRMTFTPQAAAIASTRSIAGPSSFNLVPPGIGPEVLMVDMIGQQQVSTRSGSATVSADPNAPWSKLLEGASLVTAQFQEVTGDYGFRWGSAVVSIARIKNGRTDLAVEEALALLGGIDAVTLGKQKIMLKPNLVSENPQSTTNPEVIRTLAQLMKNAGKVVSIGEGSATASGFNVINGVYYRTKNQDKLNGMQQFVFDKLGYTSLAQSLGIPLVNLHTGEMSSVAVANGFVFDAISIHHSLTDIDMLCSVPMMKTHILGGVTLGMKNLIGTYPGAVYGSLRSLIHDQAAHVETSGVAGAVVDIVRANKLGLVVIDASTAMEGNGPEGGPLVKMDLIIAGTNALATDMVAASVMGFSHEEIPAFLWSNMAGMYPQRLNQIEVRGERMDSVRRKFLRPQLSSWSNLRPSFGSQEI